MIKCGVQEWCLSEDRSDVLETTNVGLIRKLGTFAPRVVHFDEKNSH